MHYPVKSAYFVLVLCGFAISLPAADPQRAEVESAMRKATDFLRQQVSVQGGYLWRYSSDLQQREGEVEASAQTAWVQPPGTPSVGEAFLYAHKTTQNKYYLDAAQQTALALVAGQLESGGWDYRIEFGEDRSRYFYRSDADGLAHQGLRNVTTLDDNTTQAALRFLMHVDEAQSFGDSQIHDAVRYALNRLLEAQYPNGAWPQRFSQPPAAEMFPVLKASFPDTYPESFPSADYRGFYTFNDNTLSDMIATMLEAGKIYDDPLYTEAAKRAGEFILLAQMPDPQPAWAQQYNARMHPAWARKFEPPAVTGGESQGVIKTLMMLYQQTGEAKFLSPIPAALDYLERSQLPNGKLARFYELKTNRPLYFTKQYELTYDDRDLPTHYSFQVNSQIPQLRREYTRLLSGQPKGIDQGDKQIDMSPMLVEEATRCIAQMDERGAWVTSGLLKTQEGDEPQDILDMREFIQNMNTLCRYLNALD